MTFTSHIVVQDPVDAHALFDAAGAAVGLPADARWHLLDYDTVHMLQAKPKQGAAALVSVHFAPGGGRFVLDDESDEPAGYAVVGLTGPTDPETARASHAPLVARVGDWLAERGLRWCWQFDADEGWTAGQLLRPEQQQPR